MVRYSIGSANWTETERHTGNTSKSVKSPTINHPCLCFAIIILLWQYLGQGCSYIVLLLIPSLTSDQFVQVLMVNLANPSLIADTTQKATSYIIRKRLEYSVLTSTTTDTRVHFDRHHPRKTLQYHHEQWGRKWLWVHGVWIRWWWLMSQTKKETTPHTPQPWREAPAKVS